MIVFLWGVTSGGNKVTLLMKLTKKPLPRKQKHAGNSRIKYDDRIFGRSMQSIAELIMSMDDEDEGDTAIRRWVERSTYAMDDSSCEIL